MVVGELAEAVEVLVLGGGPGGYAAAIRAAQLGRAVTLVDRAGPDALGGVCLQVGCIPSKALIELAELRHRGADMPGLVGPPAPVDLAAFQVWRRELCLGLSRGVQVLLDAGAVRVLHGDARFNRPDRVVVRTPEDQARFLEFEQVIIATGSRPIELPGLPFDGERVLDSTGALALEELPASLVVVGAGYIGLELGTAFAKLGTRVTLVEAAARVLPTMDAALTGPVTRRARALGIDLRLGTVADRLEDAGVVLAGPEGEELVEAERVVVAVGRVPNTDALGLAAAGIAVDEHGLIPVGRDGRASATVAAIGDVVAGPALAHKATAEARTAAEALSGLPTVNDHAAIPMVVFSDPEIATAGLTEAQARAAGMEVRAATLPLTALGRAGTLRARDGFTRLVVDAATDRVVGVHVVGPHASELAGAGMLAVELLASPEDLAATIHPHPTLSEGLPEAAALVLGHPVHVPLRNPTP